MAVTANDKKMVEIKADLKLCRKALKAMLHETTYCYRTKTWLKAEKALARARQWEE
jgi:hypothetical protein